MVIHDFKLLPLCLNDRTNTGWNWWVRFDKNLIIVKINLSADSRNISNMMNIRNLVTRSIASMYNQWQLFELIRNIKRYIVVPCWNSVPYRVLDYNASRRRSNLARLSVCLASPDPLIGRQWYWSRRAWIPPDRRCVGPARNSVHFMNFLNRLPTFCMLLDQEFYCLPAINV